MIAPVVERKFPVRFHEIARALGIVVFVFLVSLLRPDILFDGRAGLFPSRERERIVDFLRHAERIGFEVLKAHLDEVAFGDARLVGLIFVVETLVDGEDVLLDLLVGKLLQLQRLDGVGEERARALKHGVGVAHEIDELRVGEHLDQFAHAARVGRVLREELRAARVPERNLDELRKRLLPHLQFLGRDVVEEHVFVAIFQLVFREKPEVVIRVRAHVGQRELLFLREINGQFHIVGWALVGHEPRHVFLEERLSEHHEVWKHRLIGGVVAEVLVAREHVVNERCSRAPVSEDEHGGVLQRFVGQTLLVAAFLDGRQR